MGNRGKMSLPERPAVAFALCYGLAVGSVAAALLLELLFPTLRQKSNISKLAGTGSIPFLDLAL